MASIPGAENVADELAKTLVKDNHPPLKLMNTKEIEVNRQGDGSKAQDFI